MVANKNFWQGKRVFLTGHTGFKGSWLALWLKSMGAKVYGYSLAPASSPSLFEKAKIAQYIDESTIGNICDYAALEAAFKKAQPDIVFHLAAQALVRYSYLNPIETYQTNVMGTVNLLEVIRAYGKTKACVIVTSDKCYENKNQHEGYVESDEMGGYDPYSSSKGCAELVTSAYRRSYFAVEKFETHGLSLASVRAGNVIGGGDWAEDRLIPDMIRAFIKNEKVIIRQPEAVRPWQHVLEPLNGYLVLAEKMWSQGAKYSQSYNFGPYDQDTQPVKWIVDKLSALWGDGASYELVENFKGPHEAAILRLNINKAESELGWHPRWSLSQTLEKIVVWYKTTQKSPEGAQNLCLQQISEYGER